MKLSSSAGGAGFIGSNFIRHVLGQNKGYRVVNFDKLTYAGNLANLESVAENPNYSFVKGDVCDAPAVEAAMKGCTAVVHFAAESHVDRSIYEPAPVIQTNVTGTFVMLPRAHSWRTIVLYIFPRTKYMATSLREPSRTKTQSCSPAARIRRPRRVPISSYSPTFALTNFRVSSRAHQIITDRFNSRKNFSH